MPDPLTLHVNGQRQVVDVAPETPLLLVLRNDLGLKAAKYACGLEQCGACKVIVDGEALPSCRQPVAAFVDRTITTLEGVRGANGDLHPVQRAFIATQAAQCGYCTAGFIVAAVALLRRNAAPSDQEIRQALGRHICRCGTYHRVLRAVRLAAEEMGR